MSLSFISAMKLVFDLKTEGCRLASPHVPDHPRLDQ